MATEDGNQDQLSLPLVLRVPGIQGSGSKKSSHHPDRIKFAQKRWIYEDVERQWKGHDLNEDGLVS